jgi:hypothetical protein
MGCVLYVHGVWYVLGVWCVVHACDVCGIWCVVCMCGMCMMDVWCMFVWCVCGMCVFVWCVGMYVCVMCGVCISTWGVCVVCRGASSWDRTGPDSQALPYPPFNWNSEGEVSPSPEARGAIFFTIPTTWGPSGPLYQHAASNTENSLTDWLLHLMHCQH